MLKLFNKFNKRQQNILILDIGSYQIKLVVGNFHDNKIFIKNLLTLPTPPDSYQNGEIKNLLEIKEIIKLALRENNIQVKSVLITIEHKNIIKRELTIPKVRPEELKEMIGYQVQEYFPIALEKYVIQHKVLNEFTEDDMGKYNVLVAACPKSLVDSYFQLVDFLGLEAYGLDLHSNAISKLFTEKGFIPEDHLFQKTFAVVDLGHAYVNIIILEKGIFKFNRLISIDQDEKTSNHMSILRNNSIYEKDTYNVMAEGLVAATLEINGGAGGESHKNIDSNKSYKIETYLEEMDRVFKYYTSRSTGNTVDKIFLYGGNSNIDGIVHLMQERFSTPISVLKNLNNLNLQKENNDPLSNYINAIGSLIRR